VFVEVLVFLPQHVWIDKSLGKVLDETFVLVVSDSSALVDHTGTESNDFVVDLVILLQHEQQLVFGHHQVFVAEVLGLSAVPTDGAELLAVDQQRVEQCDSKQKCFEYFGVSARIHLLVTVGAVALEHDLLDVAAGLHSHFDALLQNGHGEVVAAAGGEEQSEFRVHVHLLQVFHQFLQGLVPTRLQVGILEEQPCPIFRELFVHRDRLFALPLPEWELP